MSHVKQWVESFRTPEVTRWLAQRCEGYQQRGPDEPLTAIITGQVLLSDGRIVTTWKLYTWPQDDGRPYEESDILFEQPRIDIENKEPGKP